MSFTVAIDGPAAAGKGTISKAVAQHFGFAHLDTGLLYRAVGAKVAEGAEPVAAAMALTAQDLERDDLRTQVAADAASKVAVIPEDLPGCGGQALCYGQPRMPGRAAVCRIDCKWS